VSFVVLFRALRDASAARVTAVIPYLCYAKGPKSKPRDPVTTRYVAACLKPWASAAS
jgi:ribose-phosphate pyrophosphokinase